MSTTIEWLEAKGWHRWKTETNPLGEKVSFAKRFKTKTRCLCNETRPGIQIVLEHNTYPINESREVCDAVELILTGQARDKRWVKIMSYSINLKELKRVLNRECKKLISCWEAANE